MLLQDIKQMVILIHQVVILQTYGYMLIIMTFGGNKLMTETKL